MKTSENDVKYSNVYMGEMVKSRECCTPEREITLADLKEKQWHGNTLYIHSCS